MGHHFRRLDFFRLHQRHGGPHIVSIAAGSPDVMRKGIMHVVKVYRGAELLILRTGKEVQAAVRGQQRRRHGNQLLIRHEHKNIIEAVAAGQRHQRFASGIVAVEVMDQRLRL